jgi:hypothetical protein
MAKVYIKIDAESNIIEVNSEYFINELTDWILIDEGSGDKYSHAQKHYFDNPIITNEGIWRYKFNEGNVIEKTESEITMEISNLPAPRPSEIEMLNLKIKMLSEYQDFLEECIVEMAGSVYAG